MRLFDLNIACGCVVCGGGVVCGVCGVWWCVVVCVVCGGSGWVVVGLATSCGELHAADRGRQHEAT